MLVSNNNNKKMLCFLVLSVSVHGVTKNILDFVYSIIFSFNPVQSVIPN